MSSDPSGCVLTPEQWAAWNGGVPEERRCVYTDPEYMQLLAEFYGYTAEAFGFEHALGFVLHPRLKRPLNTLSCVDDHDGTLSDAVSTWYFGGPYVVPNDAGDEAELAKAFWPVYQSHCIDKNIVCEFFRFDPNRETQKPFEPVLPVQRNRETVWVDLEQPEQEIVAGYREACRRNIRQAQNAGLVVDQARSGEDWQAFAAIYTAEMKRKDAAVHLHFDQEFFEAAAQHSDRLVLLLAREEEKIAGGFIVALGYGVAHHFLSASRPEYWDKRVNNLMFHEAVMWSKRRGCAVFDFQGGREGVFRFKRNFSRARRRFYVARAIHDPDRYHALERAHAEYYPDRQSDAEFFPVYRQFERA